MTEASVFALHREIESEFGGRIQAQGERASERNPPAITPALPLRRI